MYMYMYVHVRNIHAFMPLMVDGTTCTNVHCTCTCIHNNIHVLYDCTCTCIHVYTMPLYTIRRQAEPEWAGLTPDSDDIILPDLSSCSERELAELRVAMTFEGTLAAYTSLCLSSLGSE